MFGDYELSLHDYLSILRRRALAMILVFGLVLAASVVVAFVLPRVYESTATILVEGPQVQMPTAEAAASRPRPEDRVNLIRQRLMTRENLIRVAEKHQLFSRAGERGLSDNDVAEAMRHSIVVDLMEGRGEQWGSNRTAISFNLSFQHREAEKALAVTRELADLFLTSNRRDRVGQATRTTEFLTGEAERVRKQLEPLEAQLAAFKAQQAGALPESSALAIGGLQSLEADLRNVERDHRLAQSELRALQVDLAAARRGVMAPGSVTDLGPSPTEQELERARAQLATLRATYSETHPDIVAQILRIQRLEQAANSEPRVQTPARAAAREQAELAASRLEAQVEAARSRVDLLASQQSSLRASIGQQRAQAFRAPQLERQMSALQRDYDATRAKYEELQTQLLSAQVVENLEGGLQAEQFTLLEPPLLAEHPVKPSRKKIVAAGFMAAVGAALGIALLLEMLLARVWGANALASVVNQRPLAVIPYISIVSETQTVDKWRRRSVPLVLLAGVVVLTLVHFWVMPLQNALIFVSSSLN